MDESAVTVTLPGGIWQEGTRHQEACLRPLAGEDETSLLDCQDDRLPAARTTHLLARCLTRLGPWEAVTEEQVRRLTVGDREALLLHLRRLLQGEQLACLLTCPRPDCGEKMELELRVSDLLL